jgi:hypothetical protein
MIERLLSMINKSATVSDDISLMLLLLYDKIHTDSRDASRSSIFDKGYRIMISKYEREIEKKQGGRKIGKQQDSIYSPVYFALLCNLHKNHKHPGAAMIALDQLHEELDNNPELEKQWHKMLYQIRETKQKQSVSETENLQNILEMAKSQEISQSNNNGKMDIMLLNLLVNRVDELEKIQKNRDQVKVDLQHFEKDRENKNRRKFYQKMRVSLSHKFTAMAVTSGGDDDEPIVKHDWTGTETM